MSPEERTALLTARERLRGTLAALDTLLGETGACPVSEGGQHEFRALDPAYGVWACALCGAQEIREGER